MAARFVNSVDTWITAELIKYSYIAATDLM